MPIPQARNGRITLAVDVSNWLRPDAATSSGRLFCHTYGRGRSKDQFIPGWPYSFVAALERGPTSWTALLDAIRLTPSEDATEVTAAQLRAVVARLIGAGHWSGGDPPITIVADAGYDVARLAYLLSDLPVLMVARVRSDRVYRHEARAHRPGMNGRPARHGARVKLSDPATWPEPARVRRGFRNIRANLPELARAPKPSRPGPGRPAGSRNKIKAPVHDVGKTEKRALTLEEHYAALG